MSFLQDKIFKLKGKVQHYEWGGTEYIPFLLGIENKNAEPYAEYWMGAHSSASSDLVTPNGELSLNHLIADHPKEFIGEKATERFGELPFLFKILDVKNVLSIQVHPSKEAAEKGFEAEEKAGIKQGSSSRNYKDKNHKPEVMVALSEFWLLHGFLQAVALKKVLKNTPEFRPLTKYFKSDADYKKLYEYVMSLPHEKVNEMLKPLIERELKRNKNNELTKDQPGWWVAKFYKSKKKLEKIDRGIFSIYFLNIVKVEPGEGIFQAEGTLHAYLEGRNAELMANSDNVLRGGLTKKHVDVTELLRNTRFDGISPEILKGKEGVAHEKFYNCPVPDFGIAQLNLKENESTNYTSHSLEIFIVINGSAEFSGTNKLIAGRGEAVAVLPGEKYTVTAKEDTLIYKAFVP